MHTSSPTALLSLDGSVTVPMRVSSSSIYREQHGIALLELAIYLPLFLFLLFSGIFVATTLNARSALTSAVHNVRLAFTRGQSDLVGSEVIADVQNWKFGGGSWDNLKPLLATPDLEDSALSHYTDMSQAQFGVGFEQLPSSYIYSHVYVAQSMVQSVGAGVRFPCNPDEPDGAGCLDCRSAPDPTTPPGTAPTEDTRFIGITCRYRPSGVIVGAVEGLLGLVSGGKPKLNLVIERSEELDFS